MLKAMTSLPAFGTAAGFAELQRGFKRILVQFGQNALVAVRGVAWAGEVSVELRVRDVLDQNNNLQCISHCVRGSLPYSGMASN